MHFVRMLNMQREVCNPCGDSSDVEGTRREDDSLRGQDNVRDGQPGTFHRIPSGSEDHSCWDKLEVQRCTQPQGTRQGSQ